MVRRLFAIGAAMVLALALSGPAQAASTLVNDGATIYTTSSSLGLSAAHSACSACHFSAAPAPGAVDGQGSNHPLAANFSQRIQDAFLPATAANLALGKGRMTQQFGTAGLDPPSTSQLDKMFKLSLYIGQYKVPVFKSATSGLCLDVTLAIKVRAGGAATKDIYPCLVDDGTGGVAQDSNGLLISGTSAGSTVTAVQNAGTAGGVSTLAYVLSYTPPPGFVPGADSFNLQVVNPSGASAQKAVPVTVYGITSGITASGRVGQVATNVHTITSNDPSATFSASLVGAPAGVTFANLGLTVGAVTSSAAGASAPIVGTIPSTAVPGTYTVRVVASINGAINPGDVTQDVTLTVAGISSSPTPGAIPQNPMATATYQITSFPAATASTYSLSPVPAGPLPSWLSFNAATGLLTITPTTSGSFQFTMGATTSSPVFAVTQGLTITITSAGAPVISTNLPSSPAIAGTVGTTVNTANYRIIASNPPIDANSYSAVAAPGSVLPPGLSFDVGTGAITGVPTASGDFSVILGAKNGGGAGVGTLPVTIRINPILAPVVTSADPAPSDVLAQFNYSIVASNGPITSYAIVAPGVLPPGLSLNTTTGAITGAPTASGVFRVNVTATNVIGLTSIARQLTFTIQPTMLATVTGPTFASLAAGVQITPIPIVATNPPILLYAATGLPPGLTLDTATGIITGTPSTPGAYSASLSANNVVGIGAARVVLFTIGIPAPTACAMSVPLNTATTLDLATCLFGGFAPTGVTIVATPAHGAAVANGTRVTYTPVHNYFGADTFTFVGSGAGGTSPQGVVTVTVIGRPDPTQDSVVTAVLAAQAQTAQRFSRAQISNFQRRMESLHRSAGDSSPDRPSLQGGVPAGPASGFAVGAALSAAAPAALTPLAPATGAIGASRSVGQAPGPLGADAVFRTDHRPIEIRELDALDAVAAGLGLKSLPFAESVFSLVKSRSVNLAGVGSGLGLNTTGANVGATSYWIEGVASFGTRDASGAMSGSEFSSNGISIGADRRLSKQLAVGMGLGYARDTTRIGTDGSNNRSRGYSLAAYGSYQPSPNTFVDAILGFGSLDFDSKRYVAPINDFAFGQRGGTQVFGSLTGGYEFRDEALLVSPYGRVDFSTDRLRNSTETGAGAYALTYFGQTSTSVQGALGVRAETVQATNFGYAVPRLRAEYRHEFQGTGHAFIGYADQPGGPRYALSPSGRGRDSIVLGIGSDFLMRDGLTLSLEYQLSHSFSNESSYALRLRLTKEFDARGLPKLLGTYTARSGEPIDVQVDASYTHDDNVTRAKAGPDKLSDDFYSVSASKTIVTPLSEQSRLLWTGTLGGDKFHHFNGLSRILGSAEAEYQYRDSSEFDAPTLGAFAKLTGEGYETRLRDGYRLTAGVSVRQALTDRINIFAALSHNRRYASSAVFSTRDNSLRTNVDYALADKQTLYFGAEYRRGDIVSTGRPSLENVSIAKVFAQDDAFPGGELRSYRLEGSTVLTTLGYNLALGPRDSLDFSWRYVRSTPGLRPAFVTSPRSYKANQLSAVYLMRF